MESDETLRGDGLVEAIRALQGDGGVTLDDADYRYTDCNGEQYGFKEDRLGIIRTRRTLKARFDHLHPADCIGEVGAAVVPCVLGMALAAARKGYAPGKDVLCHFGNDAGERAAMLLRHVERGGAMSNEVYANGREVSCKAANGKSICAFPDVCLTPPSPPAGPIPIPYPNTGMASDTDGGSKTVQISGQEVMLKDSSDFKKSTGDEAATKSQGMNVITHQIQGKCYFTSWSMDVKIEGENAVRHLDMMTHNHASTPGATPPWAYTDAAAIAADDPCKKEKKKLRKKCSPEKDWKKNCPPQPVAPHTLFPGGTAPQPGLPIGRSTIKCATNLNRI